MEITELKDLFKRAIALEKNKYGLTGLRSKINVTYEPKLERMISLNDLPAYVDMSSFKYIIGLIIGIYIGYRIAITYVTVGNIGLALGVIGGGAVLGIVIPAIFAHLKKKDELAKRQETVRSHNERADEKNAIAIAETEKKNTIVGYAVHTVDNAIISTQHELDKLYEKEFVHPKYRDLVSLSSIYEYLDSGRCDKLEGPDGAYNLYESERRLDQIITSQDEILNNLEKIKRNQYYLYQAITYTYPFITDVSKSFANKTIELDSEGALLAVEEYTRKVLEDNRQHSIALLEE